MSKPKVKEKTESVLHIRTADDMHPYDCYGLSKRIHCDKKKFKGHNPKTRALCEE